MTRSTKIEAEPAAALYSSEGLDERPVFFPAGNETLFGVFSSPHTTSRKAAVVLLGGATTPSTATGRNRISVRMARDLGASGYAALRFDYRGIGESTGEVEHFRLERPFVEDLEGAVGWVRGQGVERIVVAGSCFGARTALSAATRLGELGGVVLFAPPLRDFGMSERKTANWGLRDYLMCLVHPQRIIGGKDPRRARRYFRMLRAAARVAVRRVRQRLRPRRREKDSWLSKKNVLDPLRYLIERKVPILFVYGTEDDGYEDFREAMEGRLGDLLRRGGDGVEVATISGEIHGFTKTKSQDEVTAMTTDWVVRRALTSEDGKEIAS